MPRIVLEDRLLLQQINQVIQENYKIEIAVTKMKLIEQQANKINMLFFQTDSLKPLMSVKKMNNQKLLSLKAVVKQEKNFIVQNAFSYGQAVSISVVRTMMLLSLNAIVQGNSGVSVSTSKLLCDMLNSQVTPVVLSGGLKQGIYDITPLAQMVLAMLGEQDSFYYQKKYSGLLALKKAYLKPAELKIKEGTSLIYKPYFLMANMLVGFNILNQGQAITIRCQKVIKSLLSDTSTSKDSEDLVVKHLIALVVEVSKLLEDLINMSFEKEVLLGEEVVVNNSENDEILLNIAQNKMNNLIAILAQITYLSIKQLIILYKSKYKEQKTEEYLASITLLAQAFYEDIINEVNNTQMLNQYSNTMITRITKVCEKFNKLIAIKLLLLCQVMDSLEQELDNELLPVYKLVKSEIDCLKKGRDFKRKLIKIEELLNAEQIGKLLKSSIERG